MTDPLNDLHNYKPEPIDLSGVHERVLTPEQRDELSRAARDAKTNKELLATILGTILKVGKAVIG